MSPKVLVVVTALARVASADPEHPADAPEQPHDTVEEETIEIQGDAPAESASSIHLDEQQLAQRSRTQMSDVLRQVPGLVVAQHAGGGKADQYFIRGFDADHGTDLAVFADGVPVNLVSHGHGQGYADTHWLIPEAIASVDVHKGPYAARYGDFATAGALELKTIDHVDGPTLWISGNSWLDRRLVGMASPRLRSEDDDRSLLAVEISESDGPFVHPQDFRRGIAMAKWAGQVGHGRLELATNWYAARWNQSGQIPESLVASGMLDRFGAVDPTEGGIASRASAQIAYSITDGEGATWRAMLYGVGNQLRLYSNFTLWARDPVHGDQIEQTDDRLLYGLDASYVRPVHRGRLDALITAGVQVRADDAGTSLWHTEQRRRLDLQNDTQNTIRDVGAYVEANVIPLPWLHVFPGLRIDQLTWDVDDRNPATRATSATTGGSAARAIVSPKLSIEIHETNQVNLFANVGGGFHSNDARAAVASMGAGALARAWGGEIGARVKPTPRARVAMAAWYLRLSSEQVWNGDEGGTEASAPTRRLGLDLDGAADVTPWLELDANVTWAQASFVANAGNANAVALAPRWMGSGGATAHRGGSFVTLRARGIADRPGDESGVLTAPGYLIFDAIAGTQRGRWGVTVTLNNLLDSAWREAQFAETSRVTPAAPLVEQMHFTPGLPFTATAQLSARY